MTKFQLLHLVLAQPIFGQPLTLDLRVEEWSKGAESYRGVEVKRFHLAEWQGLPGALYSTAFGLVLAKLHMLPPHIKHATLRDPSRASRPPNPELMVAMGSPINML